MKILNPLSFPSGGVQPRRRENRPSSITRKFDTWGKGAKRQKLVAQESEIQLNPQQICRSICAFSTRCIHWCVTPTCLDGDCCRVSYEIGVDGIDGEGIVCFGTQLRHHCCAHICLQINLWRTQNTAEREQAKRVWARGSKRDWSEAKDNWSRKCWSQSTRGKYTDTLLKCVNILSYIKMHSYLHFSVSVYLSKPPAPWCFVYTPVQ